MKKKTIEIMVFGIIVCIFAIIGLYYAESRGTTPQYWELTKNILLSILCSIIASGIFTILQNAAQTDEHEQEMAELKKINHKLSIRENLYNDGILSIRKKSYYDAEGKFWNDIINNTFNRLDLIGHTISNWFEPEYKETFTKKIKEILEAGKEVHIVLSGDEPNMDMIHKIEEKGKETPQCRFDTKMDKTCWELRNIYRMVDDKYKENLHVYIAKPHDVTYMYIRTDNQCFISPYIKSKNADSNTFLLELESRTEYSKCFSDDFKELMKSIKTQLDMEG